LAWKPRYFDNLSQAIKFIRSYLPLEIRESLEDEDIARHLEISEGIVSDFLTSAGFEEPLETYVKSNAVIMHIYETLLSLLDILPMPIDRKPELLARWVEVIKETEERILARRFPPKSISAVFKAIKLSDKIGEKEE